jgi:hypothetical protein
MGGALRPSSFAKAAAGPPSIFQVGANPAATIDEAASSGGGSSQRLEIPEQLVITGTVRVEVETIGDIIAALHTEVDNAAGRIVVESVNGADSSWYAEVKIRVPPAKVDSILTWIAGRGVILDKQLSANDVSKEMYDQELEIQNQQAALDRLGKILEQGGLAMADVLAIEKEMTRIRGRIAEVKGALNYSKDRVAYATLDVTLSRRSSSIGIATAKAYPGARAVLLSLLNPGGRDANRIGVGLVVHTIFRQLSLEIDVFGKAAGDGNEGKSRAVLGTIGGAFYSDFLGRGERKTFNPYIGFRAGYGYLDSSRFVGQFEIGVEVWKSKYAALDVSTRATALVGSQTDFGLTTAVGVSAAF